MRVRIALLLGCAGTLVACEGTTVPAGVVVRDSAGIEIVESPGRAWGDVAAWTVSPDPVLDLTTAGDGPDHEFFRVTDVARLPSGDLAVALPTEIRLYSATGAHLATLGREGEGPGEFGRLRSLGVLAPDSLVAFDYWQRRVTVYGPDRALARVATLDVEFLSSRTFGVTDEGFVVMASWPSVLVPDAPMGLVRTPVPVLSVSSTGEIRDTVAIAAGSESVRVPSENGVADARPLFGRQSHVDVRGDRVVLGDAIDLEFRVFGLDGRVERIVRGDADVELAPERLDAEVRTRLGPDPSPRARAALEELPVPERGPAYGDLRVDAAGAVWLADFRGAAVSATSFEPVDWEVFGPDGAWLGQVELPGRFTVHEIGADYVLGVFRDELDVEHVQLLGLER